MMWVGIGIVIGAALVALVWKLTAPKKWHKANPSILDELSTHKRIKPLAKKRNKWAKSNPFLLDEMHEHSHRFTGQRPQPLRQPIGPPPNQGSSAKTPNSGGYTQDDATTYTTAAYQADESGSGGGNNE